MGSFFSAPPHPLCLLLPKVISCLKNRPGNAFQQQNVCDELTEAVAPSTTQWSPAPHTAAMYPLLRFRLSVHNLHQVSGLKQQRVFILPLRRMSALLVSLISISVLKSHGFFSYLVQKLVHQGTAQVGWLEADLLGQGEAGRSPGLRHKGSASGLPVLQTAKHRTQHIPAAS